ncbi:MAG: class I SAM-dependent methyltransferase [Rhizobiales bacterium]|nr:class I SAM-dependent methyltransferase [Hyphomicrobiales bacterium]
MNVAGRDYWACSSCMARFLDPRQRPARDDEYNHYLTHENDAGDARYRKFLSKLAEPLMMRLEPGMQGLDYGCGPGPALAEMLREAGYEMALHDPFFCSDHAALGRTYDFITATETIEHFHDPAGEFDRLDEMLRPGGWLGVMTSFQTDDARFADWHYVKDPTHVVFYRDVTLQTIAAQHGWACEIPVKDVALLHKQPVDDHG